MRYPHSYSEGGFDSMEDSEEEPPLLQHLSHPFEGNAMWWPRASTSESELRRRGAGQTEWEGSVPREGEYPAAIRGHLERSRGRGGGGRMRGGGGGCGGGGILVPKLLLAAAAFAVHTAGVYGLCAGVDAAGCRRLSLVGGQGSTAFLPCIAGGIDLFGPSSLSPMGHSHHRDGSRSRVLVAGRESSAGYGGGRFLATSFAPACRRPMGGQARVGRGMAVAMMAKRRKPVLRKEDPLKERSVSEIVSNWPGGLGSMKTKSQRERQVERSWEWFRFLWFRFKVNKSWVRYLKAAKLLLLYLAFSSIVSAVHVCAFATAIIAGLQVLLENEADREIPDQDRLLAELLVYWDEHEEDES